MGRDLFVSSSRLVLRGIAPTLYLRDTNERSGMIHMNSSVMYFLNGQSADSETWAQQNGQNWALQLNMNNNEATFGGAMIWCVNVWNNSSEGNNRIYFGSASNTYIRGYGNTPIEFRNGADAPIAWFNYDGELTCMFETQSQTDSDHIIIRGNTGLLARGRYRMLIGHNSFTGFHRCYYEDDELFNNDMVKEEIDIFSFSLSLKVDRIVVMRSPCAGGVLYFKNPVFITGVIKKKFMKNFIIFLSKFW
jgi:hypothetical protein